MIYLVAYHKELSLAVYLVNQALKITEWYRSKNSLSFIKKDDSPVTLADFASQIFIISSIKKYFPEDQIIAEEESSVFIDSDAESIIKRCYTSLNIPPEKNLKETLNYRGSSSKRQWTVDPIDGTKGFQKGLAYAVGMGFMVQAEPTICAIGVPNYQNISLTIFSAEKNHGARVSYGDQNFTRISVSNRNEIKKFRICHSLHYNKPWVLDFARSLGVTHFFPLDSMVKLCMVADGSSELYIKPMNMERSFTWDFLPGELLVKEAGGMITDIRGNPIQYVNDKCKITAPGLIASNGIRHEELLSALKSNDILKNS